MVVAAGSGARDEQGQIVALHVKIGDHVLFGKWSGTEAKLDSAELLIMRESDIMDIVEGSLAARKTAAQPARIIDFRKEPEDALARNSAEDTAEAIHQYEAVTQSRVIASHVIDLFPCKKPPT